MINLTNEPNISVGIVEAERIDFEFFGKYILNNTSHIFAGKHEIFIENNKIVLQSENEKLYFENELIFQPTNFGEEFFEIFNVIIGIDFHWEQKENQRFRGFLKIVQNNGKTLAINVLPIEEYLISVISSEMSANSSLELLKAHAVISRGWLVAQIMKQAELKNTVYENTCETNNEFVKWYDREDHLLFDVCADDHCQRYQGITRATNPNVVTAVNETRGQMLTYNQKICDARFSKCCGGASEVFENVWENVNHPYLTQVIDNKEIPKGFDINLSIEENAVKWIHNSPEAYCNTTDEEVLAQVLNDYDRDLKEFYRWRVSYTQKQLADLILKKSGFDFGEIMDLIPIERGVSGRIMKLKIVGTKKTLTVGKELIIRKWLSTSHLYSSAFSVEKINMENSIPQQFVLHGAGWGHGVGLCQIGAAVMGHKGFNYTEILSHYFKNTELVTGSWGVGSRK